MILIDRENYTAPGWSHVVSSTNNILELDQFRSRMGAPKSALQKPPQHSTPHLDLKGEPRKRAIRLGTVQPDRVQVFASTMAMVREHRRLLREAGLLAPVEALV